MPELPEVENVVCSLRSAGVIGRRINNIRVYWRPILAGNSPRAFRQQLKNRTIRDVFRRGKFIVFKLSGQRYLLVHLRMTGQFVLSQSGARRQPYEQVLLALDDDLELRYRDARKFGRWLLTDQPEKILGRLGPDPLANSFSSSALALRLSAQRRMLKPLLLDQTFLAGLGNIYTDEALWAAKLHPRRSAAALDKAQVQALYRAIRRVLRRGIRHGGTTLGIGQSHFANLNGSQGSNQHYLKVYGKAGRPCPRCQMPIQRLIVGQRSTHICPVCQNFGGAKRPAR